MNDVTQIGSNRCAPDHYSSDEKRLFRATDSGPAEAQGDAISEVESAAAAPAGSLNRALLFVIGCDAASASKLLINHGANVEAREPALWRRPIIVARSRGSIHIEEVLLETGAKVHAEDEFGNTVLYATAESGSAALIELLIANGSEPEHRNDQGWTPLISASTNGDLEADNVLANRRVSLEARAVLGWALLIAAAQSDQVDVICRLLELGAKRDAVGNVRRARRLRCVRHNC